MIKYYCQQCKTFIDPKFYVITGLGENWTQLSHELKWKDGQRWHTTIHNVIKIITKDTNL